MLGFHVLFCLEHFTGLSVTCVSAPMCTRYTLFLYGTVAKKPQHQLLCIHTHTHTYLFLLVLEEKKWFAWVYFQLV